MQPQYFAYRAKQLCSLILGMAMNAEIVGIAAAIELQLLCCFDIAGPPVTCLIKLAVYRKIAVCRLFLLIKNFLASILLYNLYKIICCIKCSVAK